MSLRRASARPLEALIPLPTATTASADWLLRLVAEVIGKPHLGVDPILDRNDGKIRAPWRSGRRVDGHRTGEHTGLVLGDLPADDVLLGRARQVVKPDWAKKRRERAGK